MALGKVGVYVTPMLVPHSCLSGKSQLMVGVKFKIFFKNGIVSEVFKVKVENKNFIR